jgi:hypothetical protein
VASVTSFAPPAQNNAIWRTAHVSGALPIATLLRRVRVLMIPGLLPIALWAQGPLTGLVRDAATNAPVPYCTVMLKAAGTSTLTNAEGLFRFHLADDRDSVICASLGHHRAAVSAGTLRAMGEVRLHPATQELEAVVVRPAQDRWYALVARAARTLRDAPAAVARASFALDTYMDEVPTESIEAFYNADVRGPRIRRLDLKQGRIGLAPVGDRYFVNYDGTKALALLDPLTDSEHFPTSPLQWTRPKHLRKHYRVVERGRSTADGTVWLHVSPRDTSGMAFSMDLWVDTNTARPRSLTLFCWGCGQHPFRPLRPTDRIEHLDLRSTLTFRDDTAALLLAHAVLAYTMAYRDSAALRAVSTQAVLRLFDTGRPFVLPFFRYDAAQSDYRRITFQPYDSSFWATAPTLVRTHRQERDRAEFAARGFLTSRTRAAALHHHRFFESNYAFWSAESRISLKTLPPAPWSTTPDATQRTAAIAANEVRLEAQLYLDVDSVAGGHRIFSATVFDAFNSYYRLPELPVTEAYLNLYFDLCEVERRELDAALRAPGLGLYTIRQLHAAATARMKRTTDQYQREVRLGKDRAALERWNDRVKQALGIDNLELFHLR